MMHLSRVDRFVPEELEACRNYGGPHVARYLIGSSRDCYHIYRGDEHLGVLGISRTSAFATHGFLWAGFHDLPEFSIRDIREIRALGYTFFETFNEHLVAEVNKLDRPALHFARFFGMIPTISNSNVQLFERKMT